MFNFKLLLAAVAFFACAVHGQNSTLDPNSISLTTRANWCSGQYSTCSTLCSGETSQNDCTPEDLTFQCTCTANNSQPGLQYYRTSLPTYMCEEIHGQCKANTAGQQAAQKKCDDAEKANCGTLDIADFSDTSASSSSTTASSTASATESSVSTSATGNSASSTAYVSSLGLSSFVAVVFSFFL